MMKMEGKKMRQPHRRFLGIAFGLAVLLPWFGCTSSEGTETLTYALESNGKIFGYQEVEISRIEDEGRTLVLIRESGRSRASALGAEIDSEVRSEYRIDSATWGLVSAENRIDQGSLKVRITAEADGEAVRVGLNPGGGEKKVPLGPGVIFENPVVFPHLLRDFGEGGPEAKRYGILDLIDRRVHEVTYTRRGTERLETAGGSTSALVFDYLNHDIGLKLRLWIDRENGRLLKLVTPRSTVSLAGKSVKRGLERANLDDEIFASAGVRIGDIASLSRLRARAVLEPVGNWITAESLNVPGQAFEGTVVNNRIEGVFEVEHDKFDGRNAPPYPPDFAGRPGLQPFLSPEDFIESDDPVLVAKARELTEGARDSWEAAKRLSRWVADNIGYDIPGGATARNTYDLREGECGAHSRLFVAFSRAVGIPARVVWGCMVVHDRGGSFGQHAWNEVFMGETGWVPIDTTAKEIDYADSGHIRLGVLSSGHVSWGPKEMEILDFEAGSQKFGEARIAGDPDKYRPFLGGYRGPRGGVFTVSLQGGGLAVDIPGRGVFELRDPDEKGIWYLKLSSDVGFTFPEDERGRVTGLVLTNQVRIPKKSDPEDVPGDVPEEFRPYLGQYPIPMDKREFTILYRRGNLAIDVPGGGIRDLRGPDADGGWIERAEGDRFSFILDDSGKVKFMILTETFRCPRID
jgi:transglutaminase-like putative cysteine protease